jgi:Cu+-exporting ATPase
MSNQTRLSISGMSCAGCVSSVEGALQGVAGVSAASVNFAEHTAVVEGEASAQSLIDAVRSSGYDAAELISVDDETEKEAAETAHYRSLLKKAAFAAVIGFPQFVFGMAGFLPTFETSSGRLFWLAVGLLTFVVLAYSGGHFFSGAWKSAKNRNSNMDTLIALGTGTAWVY